MRLRGTFEKFVGTKVWENALGISWVLRNQSLHFLNGRCRPIRGSLDKRETHTEGDWTLEALAYARIQCRRILVPAGVE
jgi:hypothetical protein